MADLIELAAKVEVSDWVFNWFNSRQPEEMQRCLDAYDEQVAAALRAREGSGR